MKYILFFAILFSPFYIQAEVTLSGILGNHMVVQRNEIFTIKGKCTIEKTVKVIFDNLTRNVITNDGKWTVDFSPKEAGGPYNIVVIGENRIEISDVYFGDVYLCSGQSNMQWSLSQVNNSKAELQDSNYPLIRHFTVDRNLSSFPIDQIDGNWQRCSLETIKDFSAIGFLFGRDLHNTYDIPIGLIDNAWGGSEIDPYMSESCFDDKMDYLQDIEKFKESDMTLQKSKELTKTWLDGLDNADIGLSEEWQNTQNFDSNWLEVELPGKWERSYWPDFDGAAWYAKEINLEIVNEESAIINLGSIDDSDFTYINGVLIGSMLNAYDQCRNYTIPEGVLKRGKNIIVVRVLDYRGGGGFSGKAAELNLEFESGKKMPLAGYWNGRIGTNNYPKPLNLVGHNSYPTSKYNAMMHPLIDTKLSGILWYQGESDASATKEYAWKSIRMISDYRAKWKQPTLPFIFVQLANFTQELEKPAPSNWGEIRSAQEMSLLLANTAMVTAIDVGNAEDIHPRDKQTVAKRMVNAVKALKYGSKDEYRHPQLRQARITDQGYLLKFDFVEDGLLIKSGSDLKGFSILQDGEMQFVKAQIVSKNEVLISHSNPNSTMIRFLWADNPGVVNLYNTDDMPVLPFQVFAERKKE